MNGQGGELERRLRYNVHMVQQSLSNETKAAIPLPMDAIAAFCERHRVTKFELFGSILTDRFRPESDVDVLVSFSPEAKIGLWDLAGMREELVELFGRDVHLLTRGAIEQSRNPYRRKSILGGARVIYAQ